MRTLNMAAMMAAACALVACGPSRTTDDAGVDSGAACVGVCTGGGNKDAGTDAGTKTDAGTTTDGGTTTSDGGFAYDGGLLTVTLEQLRGTSIPFRANVQVENAVVHTVQYSKAGTGGDWRADFWVEDTNVPANGIWVSKFYTDEPGPYLPVPGDQLTLNGFYGTQSQYDVPDGYRKVIKSEYDFLPKAEKPNARLLNLTKTGTVTQQDPTYFLPADFGNADGGWARPNPQNAGTRVFIDGPLEIVNTSPKALQRATANENDPVHYGFELSNGMLVHTSDTDEDNDGGCDWRSVAIDAGVNNAKVVFAGGIKGVWDSYTMSACADGGTSIYTCFKSAGGQIPGTTNDYTYVLYPQTCEDFLAPEVVPQ